jgi:prolyl-tRNA editing enzyme YbaK/EbsC (Cys-tRNA(Pro) deacylase)
VSTLHPTTARLGARLAALGLEVEVRQLPESSRTAAQAAVACGCQLGQIVKSLVFSSPMDPFLVLCAGDRRVDTDRLGQEAAMASPNEVRELTGYAIGGVPPLGHDRPLRTIVDCSLRRFDTVWCAAGTPSSVFEVDTERLIETVGGDVQQIAAGS